jgi:hypothetical protein
MEGVGAVIVDCCHARPKQTLHKHGERQRLPAHEIHMCIALSLILVDLTSLINISYCQLVPSSDFHNPTAFVCGFPPVHILLTTARYIVLCLSPRSTLSDLRRHAPLLSPRLPLYSVSSPHSWPDGDPISISQSQFYHSLLLPYTAPRVRLGHHSSLC